MIRSTDREVRALIEVLGADEARRDSAIARLIIIGPRAVARLVDAHDSTTDRRVQLAILRVLEATGDDRALGVARRALESGGDRAVQAVAVLQQLIDRGSLTVQGQALDALVAAAGDGTRERRVRQAAAQVIADVSRAIGPTGSEPLTETMTASEAVWADALEGQLPDEPSTLRAAVADQAERAPLRVIHRLIEAIRAREQSLDESSEPSAPQGRLAWRALRGTLHQVLAVRGSRLALYDLRETLVEGRDALPHSFIGALQVLGDSSCLEPLATAFARAPEHDAPARHQLATAFHAIVKRERLTRKHSALRRALARSPELA